MASTAADDTAAAPAPSPAAAAAAAEPAPAAAAPAAAADKDTAAPAAATAAAPGGAGGDAGAAPAADADATAAKGDGDSGDKKKKPKKRKRWLPLESNPEIMNKYIAGLGFPTALFHFTDVLCLEDWALEMVAQPVRAVMLLFPIKAKTEEFRKEEADKIAKDGQVLSEKVYYTKQTVGNACGTVGLIHAVANVAETLHGDVPVLKDSFFDKFLTRTADMTPDERADALEADEALDAAQAVATQEGQTKPPSLEESVETHFICFSCVDGHIYELDGRKKSPINHGVCDPSELLKKAAKVVQEFMDRDAGEMRFAITAMCPNTD